jgi:GAF domain-containing protein
MPVAGLDGYNLLAAQVQALFADERDFIANAAQFSAFLYNQVDDLNWAGFYLNRNEELVLGPFQGQVACVRIPFGKGVCGAAAARGRPSGSRMCMRSQGISPVTARRTASW